MIYEGILATTLLCFLVLCVTAFIFPKLVYFGAAIDIVIFIFFIGYWVPKMNYGKFALFISIVAGLLYLLFALKYWCNTLEKFFKNRSLFRK